MAIDPFFGSVLGAAGNLVGGLIGDSSSRSANRASEAQFDANLRRQDELAHHGIQYRAQDAIRAYKHTGIHPLALLGVQGPTFTPSSSVFMQSPLGDAVGRAGQDISRGIHATADRELRQAASSMQVERYKLENELIKARIASEMARTAQMTGPSMPGVRTGYTVDGQGSTAHVRMRPQDVTRSGRSGLEPSSIPGVGYLTMPDGSRMPVKSKGATEQLEDDFFGNLKHFMLRQFGPYFNENAWRPNNKPRKGYEWRSDWKGDYYERKVRPRKVVPGIYDYRVRSF